jgi:ATP-dependent DNA helicase RecQ
LNDFIYKEIEQYGVLHLTEDGKKYMEHPRELMITLNRDFNDVDNDPEEMQARPAALDNTLLKMLKDVRKTEAKKKNVPPYIIFQDPSLEDMATQYPITMEELAKVSGVSAGKAQKYGKAFIALIAKYVEENDIERAQDFVIKQVANQSKTKVAIIKGTDKKVPLAELARQNQMNYHELMDELNIIVTSGMKLNLDYCIDDIIDDGVQEEIYSFFMTSETDNIDDAYKILKEDDEELTYEEVQLIRLKFLSEVAN